MHGRAGSSIQDVTARHAEALMALPGVVSVGIGCNEKGVAVIVIGLEREAPGAARQLPDRIDGFEVRTEVVGRYRAQR
jgi:hypothetical protein